MGVSLVLFGIIIAEFPVVFVKQVVKETLPRISHSILIFSASNCHSVIPVVCHIEVILFIVLRKEMLSCGTLCYVS